MGRPKLSHCACDYCAHVFNCDMIPQCTCKLFKPGSNYPRYLCLSHWKLTRAAKLIENGGYCELCGSRDNLHVHHLSHETIFCEKMEDLQVLCCRCHAKVRMIGFRPEV